jgi:two-component system nitrate/nitrite response regulator NarL
MDLEDTRNRQTIPAGAHLTIRSGVTVLLISRTRLLRDMISRALATAGFVVLGGASYIDGSVVGPPASDVAWHADLVILSTEGETILSSTLNKLRELATGKIVLLMQENQVSEVTEGVLAATDGILSDDVSADALVQGLSVILRGERVVPRQLAQLIVAGRPPPDAKQTGGAQTRDVPLSRRETEIVRLVALGESNKLIAYGLNITEATVKVHLKAILRKISAQNRTQAAVWAVNNGFAQKTENC